jgi:hypothetical protein
MESKDPTEFWKNELWQIIRMHNKSVRVKIELTPDFGDAIWVIKVFHNEKQVHYNLGKNLWKRLRSATEELKLILAEETYKYEK